MNKENQIEEDDDIDAIRKRIGIQEKRYTEENK